MAAAIKTKKPVLFTVGHSTRPFKEFRRLLEAYGVKQLIDVRTIPRSRHNPQFNEKRLAANLKRADIGYLHDAALGGLRHAQKDSINAGWRNASFRGYADYMQTDAFAVALRQCIVQKLSCPPRKRLVRPEYERFRIARFFAFFNESECHIKSLYDFMRVRKKSIALGDRFPARNSLGG